MVNFVVLFLCQGNIIVCCEFISIITVAVATNNVISNGSADFAFAALLCFGQLPFCFLLVPETLSSVRFLFRVGCDLGGSRLFLVLFAHGR